LEQTLEQIKYTTGKASAEAICDRGYKGKCKINETIITIPKPLPKNTTRHEIEKVKQKFRRRCYVR